MEPTIQQRNRNIYDSEQQIESLRLMLEDAAKNPNTKRADELRKVIETGRYNFELKALGLEPVKLERPKIDLQAAMQGVQEDAPMTRLDDEAMRVQRNTADTATFAQDRERDRLEMGQTLLDILDESKQRRQDIRGRVERGEISVGEGTAETMLLGLGSGLEFLAETGMGLVKMALPQSIESKVDATLGRDLRELADPAKLDALQERLKTSQGGIVPGTDIIDRKIGEALEEHRFKYNNDPIYRDRVDSVTSFGEVVMTILGARPVELVGRATQETIGASVEAAAPVVRQAGESAQALGRQIGDPIGNALRSRQVAREVAAADAERAAIQEMIAPKLDLKEGRRAAEQGRVTRGQESFFFGKKPDVVEVEDRIKEISGTIQRRIDGAATLDDIQLSNRISNEIVDISENLAPRMAEVRLNTITPTETPIAAVAKTYNTKDEFLSAFTRGELDVETVEAIQRQFGEDIFDAPDLLGDLFERAKTPTIGTSALNAWESLKKRQINNPEYTAFAGVERFQNIFEKRIQSLANDQNKTLEDLWNMRKAYDASISERIKQANDLSPVTSQIQKAMWLENRRILNDLINDSARGLGGESRKAFSDMSQLYTAKENIISKVKIDQKGEQGVIGKTTEAVTNRLAPFGVGGLIF